MFEADEVEVWPENWAAVSLFARLGSQWRTGFSGPLGLEYSVLFRLMDQRELMGEDWWQMLDDIQVMEAEALSTMNKRSD